MDIQKWIDNGRDYATGLAHYKTLPDALPVLVKTLSKGDSMQNREKLISELKKRLAIPAAAKPAAPKKTAVVPAKPVNKEAEKKQALLFHQLPPELRPVYKTAMDLYRENCMLKVALNELAPEQEAEALQLQITITQNFRKNAACWQKIDYWLTHNAMPPMPAALKEKFDGLTGGAQARRQQNLFSSRSKLKKRIQETMAALELATSIPERTKLTRKLAKQRANLINQEAQLEELTNIINGTNEPGQ